MQWTLPDGRSFLASARTQNGYLLQFAELADFFIDNSGSEILYSARPGVPQHSIRHLILDTVIAFALSVRGLAVLHASAIVTQFGACAFAASSGIGKSTLAASFQKAGYATLTDDCLLLETDQVSMYGVPSYPGMRLREDSLSLLEAQDSPTLPVAHYNSKRRFANGLFADGRERLGRFIAWSAVAAEVPPASKPSQALMVFCTPCAICFAWILTTRRCWSGSSSKSSNCWRWSPSSG